MAHLIKTTPNITSNNVDLFDNFIFNYQITQNIISEPIDLIEDDKFHFLMQIKNNITKTFDHISKENHV